MARDPDTVEVTGAPETDGLGDTFRNPSSVGFSAYFSHIGNTLGL